MTDRIVEFLQSKKPYRENGTAYRDLIVRHYDGLAGWFTRIAGMVNGNETLGWQIIGKRGFDLAGCRRVLDAGCGNGRYLRTLVARADPGARIIGVDLSQSMLLRARKRTRSPAASLVKADITRLPFADHAFDAIVCGWALEHVYDPVDCLRELRRVLAPAGKILLMTTEDTILGAISSRFYHCKTHNRRELRATCLSCGLAWHRVFLRSHFHERLGFSGIIVELAKVTNRTEPHLA